MRWKILLTDGMAPVSDPDLLGKVELDDRKGISAEELLEIVDQYDAVIVRGRTKVREDLLSSVNNLKVVGRMGVGVDNIDLQTAAAHGITVVNAPVATTVTVAELTLGLMLGLLRKIPRADAGMKAGDWLKKQLVGAELYQKTLGVIGFGHIGEAVARRALAFGARVVAYDPIRPAAEVRAAGVEPVDFDTLLAESDLITLHIPHIPATHHILDEAAFAKMKDGVHLICAARGGVIDESALLTALESGQVAGAALDVYEQEPPVDSALPAHPHVVATPHIGAQTKEAQLRAAYDILSEVVAALEGQDLRWKIV